MLTLKTYQQNALDVLTTYCQQCAATGDPDVAFYTITRQHFHQGIPYRAVAELPGLPYVCIRIPTGGGKTLVASHATGVVAQEFLHSDRPLALWLTPSNVIRSQTLASLRDRRHPYRQALEQRLGASVVVLDMGEALYITRAVLDAGAVIFVATMQAFRVEETDGRKVYDDNGSLLSHFDGQPAAALADLDCFENGQPVRSLANVLRLRRPIVIVDEAHNARTELSFATLARFRPSCIVEFTATPATGEHGSNVLYSVSAAELKAESMIKLPMRLTTHSYWKELLHDAINLRQRLEKLAEDERLSGGAYIRPIMLLQADKTFHGRETINVEVLERTLRDDFHIPAGQIARATGAERGIEGVDLLARECPIRFIITVQALREGWDCPFAYVLFSVVDMRSGSAVEQMAGRILRMPYAARRAAPELNLAYAFSTSSSFAAAVIALRDALVENGFERQSAEDFIERAAATEPGVSDLPLWRAAVEPAPQPAAVVVSTAPHLGGAALEIASLVRYDPARNELKYLGERMDATQMEALMAAFHNPQDRTAVQRLFERVNRLDWRTPSQRKVRFAAPLLAIRQGDLLEPFEEVHLLEQLPATLQGCSPLLTEADYTPALFSPQTGVIDIGAGGHVQAQSFVGDLHRQMSYLDADRAWSDADLVRWLDRRLPDRSDLSLVDSQAYLTRLLVNLVSDRQLALDTLARDRHRLLGAVAKKLAGCRASQRQTLFQALLVDAAPAAGRLEVSDEHTLIFDPESYPYNQLYTGPFSFSNHYYPHIGDMNNEEAECALWLDQHPAIEFWVRNIERRPESFSLQTHSDKFYPDFVCKLRDGRILVVEYKSLLLWSTDDSREKRDLGDLWARRSEGRCLFVMPKGKDFAAIQARLGNG